MLSNRNPASRLWGLIPAAGKGQRIGTQTPKQYHQLAGKTVLDWSIEALIQTPSIDAVMLVLAADDTHWSESAWNTDPRLCTTIGGEARCDSVLAGLSALKGIGAGDSDRVLVHDAARPCVPAGDIKRLLTEVGENPNGGLLASPVRDTLKRAGDGAVVAETMDRSNLWQALTPQCFPLGSLLQAIEAAAGESVTDESQAMERAGWQPILVKGSAENMKYTYPDDAEGLARVLAMRKEGSQ